MAKIESDIRITPSVLDRLLDYDPLATKESLKSRSRSITELKQAVKRDLEWLLNARQNADGIPENLVELNRSVFAYGLPDTTGTSAKNQVDQKKLIAQIETAIKNFEPRFLDLKVTMEPIDSLDRTIRFKIEAQLDVEPTPEAVTFDTVLQLGGGGFNINSK
jgi:type VI secretion system protein ImpF